MNSKRILVAYGIISCIELFAAHSPVRYVTKPLLMIVLAMYVMSAGLHSTSRNRLLFTLLFAWLGDVFLLLPGNSALYFQLGLGSFLIMQLAYIRQFIQWGAWKFSYMVFPVFVYVGSFLGFLYPHLSSSLLAPVIVYAFTLGAMLYFAFQLRSTQLRFGAFLFVVSDSLLAFGKFYFEYPWNSCAVMSTYILAQLLLTYALCKLHTQRKS
jgi:uncharacterized membrane protein YhhN